MHPDIVQYPDALFKYRIHSKFFFMKKISTALLLMLLGVTCLYGQTPSDTVSKAINIGWERHHLYSCDGERILHPDKLFADTPAAYTWQKGIRQQKTGKALLISAGALTACGFVVYGIAIGGLDRGTSIAGLSIMSASLPFYAAGASMFVIGKKNKKKAVNMYNEYMENTQACIGLHPSGLQFLVLF